jgi:hypothetical protein
MDEKDITIVRLRKQLRYWQGCWRTELEQVELLREENARLKVSNDLLSSMSPRPRTHPSWRDYITALFR